jgi:SH3-like domain-containing protein
MREGPTYGHPILWVYRRKGLPVEIIGQYDVWRRVRDSEGTTGWIHSSMIAETRTVLVTAKSPVVIRREDDSHARILALAQRGVVAKLLACSKNACEVDADGTEGWIDKKNIWGVKTGEVFH